jgi:hypothetical protein
MEDEDLLQFFALWPVWPQNRQRLLLKQHWHFCSVNLPFLLSLSARGEVDDNFWLLELFFNMLLPELDDFDDLASLDLLEEEKEPELGFLDFLLLDLQDDLSSDFSFFWKGPSCETSVHCFQYCESITCVNSQSLERVVVFGKWMKLSLMQAGRPW